MVIFATVVACIAFVIGLINLMSIGLLVNNSITTKNNPQAPQPMQSDDEDANDEFEYARGYTECRETIIGLLRLALYDMYTTHDLLDYESTSMEIFERMDTVTNDEAYRQRVVEQFTEFMEGRENDSNNY